MSNMRIYSVFIILTATIGYGQVGPSSAQAACSWSGNVGTVAAPYAASDVQKCVNDASSLTGSVIIKIPNSSATWSSGISVKMNSGFTKVTSLTIAGLNACTVDAKDRPTACGTNIANFNLSYYGVDKKAFRLSNMKISGNSRVSIDGSGKSWRFDHLLFDSVAASADGRIIWITSSGTNATYGVIDSCTVNNSKDVFIHFQQFGDGGNYSWMRDLGLGGPDAFYLENSTFNFKAWSPSEPITDANGAARYVFRTNDVTNGYIQAHDAIVTNARGVRKWEVYNNTFTYDANGGCFAFAGRGGTGVLFNNTISDPYKTNCRDGIQLSVYRAYQTGGNPWTNLCSSSSGNAILDTSSDYPRTCSGGKGCIKKDGSSTDPDGYPCRDQTGIDGNNPQVSRPFLFWNNRRNGKDVAISLNQGAGSYIVQDRDFCTHSTTMPALCNGVTTSYTPYPYPHPLTY